MFTKDEADWILNLLVSEYTSEPQCESIIAKLADRQERGVIKGNGNEI